MIVAALALVFLPSLQDSPPKPVDAGPIVEDKAARATFEAFERSVEQAKSLRIRFMTSIPKDGYSVVVSGVLLMKGARIRAELTENDPGGIANTLGKNQLEVKAKPKRIHSDGKTLVAYYGDDRVLDREAPKHLAANLLASLTWTGVGLPLAELPLVPDAMLLRREKSGEEWLLKSHVRREFRTFENLAKLNADPDRIGYSLRLDTLDPKKGLEGIAHLQIDAGTRVPKNCSVQLWERRDPAKPAVPPAIRLPVLERWPEFTLDPVLPDEEFDLPAAGK
jgi:hypothetical protein